jgi:mannose-1-phosphate guanylyltransferase
VMVLWLRMITVIIAGGSGTRLWPLSTPQHPKHLLKINGDSKSLVQRTYDRSKKLSEAVYVVPEVSHIDHIKQQLPELKDDQFIVEPARRGTANCIVAALVHLKDRHPSDEPIAFIAADHYIRDTKGFVHSFNVAAEKSAQEQKIVLVGVEPTYASMGFGYIQKDETLDQDNLVYKVHSFREKPPYATAKEYFESGNYLWNCGYFLASSNTFVEALRSHAPELYDNYRRLLAASASDYEPTYLGFQNLAIDSALIEKVDQLLVVPASFDWMDLGSFRDLHFALGSDERGNVLHGQRIEIDEVENSLIQNEEDKPIAVIGLDNVVVVNTPDGILVARKDLSQKVGEISKRFTVGGQI